LPAILFVRHGQASFGEADYDVLSPTGVRQAQAVGDELLARGIRVDRLVTGGLGRQRATAEGIASRTGNKVEIDERFDEYSSDDILENLSDSPVRQDRQPGMEQVSSREFQEILEPALLDWIAAGAGGPCHTPYAVFAERLRSGLHDLGRQLGSGETAVVCTSGGVLACLAVAMLGVAEATFVPLNRVTVNAGITRVAYGRSGATLLSYNEQGHLLGHEPPLLTYR
jgi:broad specificity phosphatase PhoE